MEGLYNKSELVYGMIDDMLDTESFYYVVSTSKEGVLALVDQVFREENKGNLRFVGYYDPEFSWKMRLNEVSAVDYDSCLGALTDMLITTDLPEVIKGAARTDLKV